MADKFVFQYFMQEGPCNYGSCAQTLGQLCSRQSHAGTAPPKPPLEVPSSSRPLSIRPSPPLDASCASQKTSHSCAFRGQNSCAPGRKSGADPAPGQAQFSQGSHSPFPALLFPIELELCSVDSSSWCVEPGSSFPGLALPWQSSPGLGPFPFSAGMPGKQHWTGLGKQGNVSWEIPPGKGFQRLKPTGFPWLSEFQA